MASPEIGNASSIGVLVADGDAMAERLLLADLQRQRQFHLTECPAEPGMILDRIRCTSPEILLMTANLPQGPTTCIELLQRVRSEHPNTRVVVFGDSLGPGLVAELFRAGVKGIFARADYDVKRLCRCIRSVAAGQIWATSEQIGFAMNAFSEAASFHIVTASGDTLLTRRQQEVVRLVARGYGNRAIAEQLGLSEHTVKNYLFNIFNKLGISSRAELVMYSLSHSDHGACSGWEQKGTPDEATESHTIERFKEVLRQRVYR